MGRWVRLKDVERLLGEQSAETAELREQANRLRYDAAYYRGQVRGLSVSHDLLRSLLRASDEVRVFDAGL